MTSYLAGYISGAGVDLARVKDFNGRIELFDHAHFVSKGYRDLDSILNLYLKKKVSGIDIACFGVAGPVIKNEVKTTNLPWHIIGEQISGKFSIGRVKLVNDIVATAHGLTHLANDRFFSINEGKRELYGNLGLIAAGAGLGEALIYQADDQMYPYASEGGHADFSPGNQIESELWEYIYSELGAVEVEDVLSLAGLERIHNFLIDTQGGKAGDWIESSDNVPLSIIEKALAGKDSTASRTLEMFVECLASETANLALRGMTLGGVYIGGIIAPQIITALEQGKFMNRFIKRGKMETLLTDMPVGVIIEEKTALLGAAGMTLELDKR